MHGKENQREEFTHTIGESVRVGRKILETHDGASPEDREAQERVKRSQKRVLQTSPNVGKTSKWTILKENPRKQKNSLQ